MHWARQVEAALLLCSCGALRARLDKILMSEVIKKKNKNNQLREMCRVLRKNGVLFAIERSPDNVDGLTTEGDNKLTKKQRALRS